MGLNKQFSFYKDYQPDSSVESVVAMAVYAGDKLDWIRQAVDSILTQSYQDFLFVIVVDGYVPDSFSQYLSDIANKEERVWLIFGQDNKGLSTCMNHVIDVTQSLNPMFFFRMDADDVSVSCRLKKQRDYLVEHPEISICGSALDEINEQGDIVGKRPLPLSHEEIVKFLPKRCSINHPTVCMRYTIFEQGYRYREECKNIEDYFLWVELASNGFKFTNLSESLLKFRRANDFFVRRGISKSYTEFQARMYAMKRLNKRTLSNYLYALMVLVLRVMPANIIKLAYTLDRKLLELMVKR